ncbi:MAG: CrcB protein [bacterium]|jgi:CrcB protein
MMPALWVALGGASGATLRFVVSSAVQKQFPQSNFPFGTFTVNILGCLIIGILAGISEQKQLLSNEMRMLLITGVLGGFTTFSSFGLESFQLLKTAQLTTAFANLFLHLLLGLLAVWLGGQIARLF